MRELSALIEDAVLPDAKLSVPSFPHGDAVRRINALIDGETSAMRDAVRRECGRLRGGQS